MAVVTTRESSMNRDRINETQNDVNVSSSPPAAEAILTLLRCLKFDAGALNEDRVEVKRFKGKRFFQSGDYENT